MAASEGAKSFLKLILLIFTLVFVCAGLMCIGVGIWMKVDQYVAHFFTIAAYNHHVSMLHAGSTLFIAAGVIVVIIGALGFLGTIMEKRLLLVIFIGALALVMCLQLCAAILAVVFRENIYYFMRDSMKNNLQEYYVEGSSFAHAWDFVQIRMKCCGAQGPEDYMGSRYEGDNIKAGKQDRYVPNSCCKLIFDQDRDVSRVNPEDAKPQNLERCQRDAHGNIPTEFLHGYGCFIKIHRWVYDRSTILMGIGFAAGIFQIIGLVAAILYLSSMVRQGLRKNKNTTEFGMKPRY